MAVAFIDESTFCYVNKQLKIINDTGFVGFSCCFCGGFVLVYEAQNVITKVFVTEI